MRKSYRKPHLLKKEKPLLRNKYFWLGTVCLVLAVSLFCFLFFSDLFQVNDIVIIGEDRVERQELFNFIDSRLANNVLFTPTRSIFFLNLGRLERDILESYPQIAQVSLRRGYPDSLHILVVERREIAFWCQEVEEEEKCFLVDIEGVIFEPVLVKPVLAEITRPGLGETKLNLGDRIVEEELLGKILYVESKLKELLEIEAKEVIVLVEYFQVLVEDGWLAYFNPAQDLDWQITKLGAVLEEKIPIERIGDLEYIDLRFGNLAPFKYK